VFGDVLLKDTGLALMNILRRISLSRLLLLCGLVVVVGVSATAIAAALGSGPTPAAKPLAGAIHDALAAPSVEGVSASVTLTDHLLEGASLAGGGHSSGLTSSPLITGASGRLWIAKDGRVRLELQSEGGGGDSQILYDGHTLSLYDAATNTLYRYVPPAHEPGASSSNADHHEVPSVAKIEEAISHLGKHANVSGATPTDVAGQPAYTVRVSPKEGGSLFGGVELSFDAVQGVPLRAAIYSSTSASPVIELAATEVSYGPVADSVFDINPPANAKIEEVKGPDSSSAHASGNSAPGADKPKITTDGHGPAAIAVLESKTKTGAATSSQEPLEGLPKVTINGTSASELRTELGTLLSFERGGVRYLLAGSVPPAAIEALARGL
jgi:outer membrane lipoprotein-sorting protein